MLSCVNHERLCSWFRELTLSLRVWSGLRGRLSSGTPMTKTDLYHANVSRRWTSADSLSTLCPVIWFPSFSGVPCVWLRYWANCRMYNFFFKLLCWKNLLYYPRSYHSMLSICLHDPAVYCASCFTSLFGLGTNSSTFRTLSFFRVSPLTQFRSHC